MFPAVFEKKNGSLVIRYLQRERLSGFLLIVIGGFLLPGGIAMLLSSGWYDKIPWMITGLGSITEAGGLLLFLRSRFLPLGFQLDRTSFRILEKKHGQMTLPMSFFSECGIRSSDGRKRGPFYLFVRGDSGLDLDLCRHGSLKKAQMDLQTLTDVTHLRPGFDGDTPEGRLRAAFALPEIDRKTRLEDRAPDLRTVRRRLQDEKRIHFTADRKTIRFRDPAGRRHSSIALLVLLFILSMGITAFLEGIPLTAAIPVFAVLTGMAGWIVFATLRSLLFDDGLTVRGSTWKVRRFMVFNNGIKDSVSAKDGFRSELPTAVMTFNSQTGVPAVGYFDQSYRSSVQNLSLNPIQMMKLSFHRFFAFPHRFYGYTLTESIALYSIIREVLLYGGR